MTDKQKSKQIKDDLKALGFKEKNFHLGGKSYNYDTKQTFNMHIRFYEANPYVAAQITIESDKVKMSYTYAPALPLSINFGPNELDSLVSAAKKSIKIIADLNKKFEQIITNMEKFNNLV